ncbi:hypothetical protein JOD29_000721 [Lysinibacillus composti]|uniref:Uncharacterized protein n=1 Tax=Lysinibacillus composti TaxID=720633 RepID=A0A3N9UA15_9BACI|nr:hypothetical protein [Lysinibacillus composti]MBM7607484.1 hypothetical protein [Lysinibacillus composti]RQW73368.1 hypothetical protein EBB45_17095 [Lysinibacillus composti]
MSSQRRSSKDWQDGNRNDRFDNDVIIDRNSLIIEQNFCVNAIVGGERTLIIEEVPHEDELLTSGESSMFEEKIETANDDVTIRQSYTLIYRAPSEPIRASLLMTVIAKNQSENDVLISIEDAEGELVEEVIPTKSELALTIQNAVCIRALALSASRVQFFISAFYPTSPM